MAATTIFLLCALFHVANVGATDINQIGTKGNPISTNMKLIATVDGKSFFADRTVNRNWKGAKQYCAEFGMKLGEITSKAQTDALQAAYHPTDFDGAYWTAGRDIQKQQQFVWDSSKVVVSNDYPPFYIRTDKEYQTCVYYQSWPSSIQPSTASFRYCHETIGTLCET